MLNYQSHSQFRETKFFSAIPQKIELNVAAIHCVTNTVFF